LRTGNDAPQFAWDARFERLQTLPDVRVLIVDDFEPWSELVVSILEEHGGIEIVAVASNGRDGVRKAVDLEPDVVLLDINLPDMNGFEAARLLQMLVADSRIVFVSGQHSPGLARAAIAAGVLGYVAKSDALTELAAAIAAVSAGKMYMSAQLAAYRLFDDDKR
jgi:two-component system response regulator DesR